MDCPLLASSPGNDHFFGYQSKITKLYFNLPKATGSLDWSDVTGTFTAGDSDASDWHLDSITAVGKVWMFASCRATGTLRLPSVTSISAANGKNNKFSGLEIGTAKTNATITIGANIAANAYLTNVVLGGVGCTLVIGTNAFASATLTHVRLNSPVPTFAAVNATPVFGTASTPARTIFFVPELNDSWNRVMISDAVTPLTASERAAFAAEHPGEAVPYGVIAPEVLKTAAEQYVVYPEAFLPLPLSGSTTGGGTVEVRNVAGKVLDPSVLHTPKDALGELTFTATPTSEAWDFAEWEGFPTNVAVRTNPLVLTLGPDTLALRLTPRFSPVWAYAPTVQEGSSQFGLLTHGDWKLNTCVLNEGERTLYLGLKQDGVAGYEPYGKGINSNSTAKGVLDISGRILDGNGAAWRITALRGRALSYASDHSYSACMKDVTALYLPTSLTSFAQSVGGLGWLDKLVIDCPSLLTLPGYTIYSTTARDFVMRLPQATSLGGSLDPWGGPGESTLLENWNLEKLTSIGASGIRMTDASGTLSLPALQTMAGSGIIGFGGQKVVFGRPTQKKPAEGLRALATGAFAKRNDGKKAETSMPNLTELEFLSKREFVVSNDNFRYAAKLSKVTILGVPPSAESLSNIVAGVATAADKKCSIYVGMRVVGADGDTWESRVDPVLTAEEEAFRPASTPECTFLGVLDNPLRNCWVFGIESPYDPRGAVLLIR